MLRPSIFGNDLFDDLFAFPDYRDLDHAERKLYGRHPDRLMKTDIHEHDDCYNVDIDLPGFKKEELKLDLENGYLTVSASKEIDNSENDDKGKLIRQERYSGAMQRSFYVGENIKEEDIKAAFKHGVLSLTIPKKDKPEVPEKKQILIE